MHHLNAVFTVVEHELARKEQRRRLQPARPHVVAAFAVSFPASGLRIVVAGLIALHLFDLSGVCEGDGAVLDPDLIAVCVISVMMSVERKANRLVGYRADFWDYRLCA